MADGTKIEWTDATWNVINGCSVVSPGCKHCYAMRLAGTRLRNVESREGLTVDTKAGPVWNGTTRFNDKVLLDPIRWKRPRRIFVCAHGDLFHDSVPDAWIDRVFAVMALAPQHQFQVLTKRADRMRAHLARPMDRRIGNIVMDLREAHRNRTGKNLGWIDPLTIDGQHVLPNVWLGVSIEDQERAEQRIPDLLATPAAVRWISAEPLLGPIDINPWLSNCYECGASCGLRLGGPPEIERCTECWEECGPDTEPAISEGCPKCGGELEFICPDCDHYMVYQHPDTPVLDWVVVGGESGPRPMRPDWVRAMRDQCAAAHVPFFFKQWGSYLPAGQVDANGRLWNPACGSNLRAVKSLTGRLLDGVTHDGMPA